MKTPVREILARNLRTLMSKQSALKTQMMVAKKADIAQTSVSNMLRPGAPPSPRLDQVEKVARAFGLSTWQILLDPQSFGGELADMVMRPSVPDGDERLIAWADTNHRSKGAKPKTENSR